LAPSFGGEGDKKNRVGKIKIPLSLSLINLHATNTYGGTEVYFHVFLTSALDEEKW
jgi:hypothetical protein